jgi:RNA polymerase sigma factor (sigma-70 family)
MATIITNYTTYDMAYYYRDTKRLPRLSKAEERQLVASLAAPTSPSLPAQQMTQIKQRLIEGHLGLATCIAADLCPRRCRDLYADLVQEANLGLIQATNRFDYPSGGNFTAYVAAWMRGRVKQALADDGLIKIDYDARKLAQRHGTLGELRALQHPLSLDCLLDEHDPDSTLLDSLEAPSQAATPVCDPHTHEQVEALLSYLSPRAQTIVRLRYGLVEGDERPHTEREIARALGISHYLVHTTVYDAFLRLRALVSGQATISQRNGKPCISLPGCRLPKLSPEREAALLHACHCIEAQGRTVTVRLLAQETGLPKNVVVVFLRQLRGKTATSAQAERQARQARLEAAYAQLEAAGKLPSERVLARTAQVDKMTALRFLQQQHAELTLSRQTEQHARRARLEAAYRRLEAAGKPFSGRALAREAQVALSTAQHFLRKPVGCHA